VLGEFVTERSRAEESTSEYQVLLERLASEKLDGNISVKLTAIGLDIGPQFARENARKVLERAAKHGTFVRIDMENSPYTTETLKLYDEFRKEFRVGVALQAYMRKSSEDVRKLMENGATNFRLCKGIYMEAEEIAFRDREEIRNNFVALLDQMFSGRAYVGIATHDDVLVNKAEKLIAKHKLNRDQYEFQMLLGVRHDLRNAIVSRGHRLRVYVPYGESWYGYSTRRLKENPQLAGYVFKNMFRS